MKIAQLILIDPMSRHLGPLSYCFEEGLEIGDLVEVRLKSKAVKALILDIVEGDPHFEVKTIDQVVEKALLSLWQIQLLKWMSNHYLCSEYDVLKSMVPKRILNGNPLKRLQKNSEKISTSVSQKSIQLSSEQEKIVSQILKKAKSQSLIYGITGSGKTEVYKACARKLIQDGKQVLMIVPEIALTPQLTARFKDEWENLVVIHSRISEGERMKNWRAIREGKVPLVIGSRSAIFAPFKDLGLIVVDEEHEWTYKQEQSPRYHARDTAYELAKLSGAHLILGSATPCLETWAAAQKGEIDFYELKSRPGLTPLPKIELVDLREELKAGNQSILSEALEKAIEEALNEGEQCMLFLNRRGAASATVCRDCGEALKCRDCEMKLTHHRQNQGPGILICHHCGLIHKMPEFCPQCQSPRIRHFGIGTQKVEAVLKERFPSARIFRADADTMGKKDSHDELHHALHGNQIDILIGTQMISKGLDLPKLSLVGVILADLGIHFPDFRASEKSFQLLVQVSGRAGRREKQGKVLIQTYSPENPSIQKAAEHDLPSFYEEELVERKLHELPPFGKLIGITVLGKSASEVEKKSKKLLELLHELNAQMEDSIQICGAPALIPKIRNQFFWKILLQGKKPEKLILKLPKSSLAGLRIDVDPMLTV